MDLPETLEIKSDALKFCGKVLKIINDLSLKVETSFDGDSIKELFEDSKKKNQETLLITVFRPRT